MDALVRVLRLRFTHRRGRGFFLRSESFFNVASYLEEQGIMKEYGGYGGVELHERSHSESLLALLQDKYIGEGLFFWTNRRPRSHRNDSSPSLLLHETLKHHKDAHFIISTHSHPLTFGETSPAQIVGSFPRNRDATLDELFKEIRSCSRKSKEYVVSARGDALLCLTV